MSVARSYQKYPEAVKIQIAKSQNPYLFPEYKIPRTTALYWIVNQSKSLVKPISEESLAEQKIKALEYELQKEKSLTSLVARIRAIFPHSFKDQRVPTKTTRRKIVEAVKVASKANKVSECLKLIGLSKSTYSNWLSEFYLCEDPKGRCQQRKPHQISHDEIEVMKNFITSKRYSHFSIQSLCLLAQRRSLLFCSLDSWYKYKKIFGWNRPRGARKEKTELIGIRAKLPNEIWHVDVTQVKISNGRIIYIQAVYDNFSRFILAWKVTTDVSAVNTVELIAAAKQNAAQLGNRKLPTIMTDGGSENDNRKVLNFITSKNIKRLIARVDIHFSNSMIESLFRMLKSNFLRHENLRSLHDVERKIDFFFTEHNEVIPRYQFRGATPREKYLNIWTDSDFDELKEARKAAMEKRKSDFKVKSCAVCKGSGSAHHQRHFNEFWLKSMV